LLVRKQTAELNIFNIVGKLAI